MTTTYELTTGTREDFNSVQTLLINDFINQVTGASVHNTLLGNGFITSCLSPSNNFESIVLTVHFDIGETKHYALSVALATGSLKFTDESLSSLYDKFMKVHNKLKSQLFVATEEARRREKDEAKKAERIKKAEANYEQQKEKALRDFESLTETARTKLYKPDEFFYSLGWLASHIKTVKAIMPDYLEAPFVNRFGNDALHSVVDSKKRTVNGYPMQWAMGFQASLPKNAEVPMNLTQYLSASGKFIANTPFLWDLVENYGFKFSKKQDILEIMRCVPIEFVPAFNDGYNTIHNS